MTELRYGTPEEAGLDPARIELARRRAAQWVAEGHTPSLVVLAARNGVIALHEAFGQRTPAGDPLLRDSVFAVLSLSKPLTAAAVLTLVEDGLLGLQRPVASYLPELAGDGRDDVLVAHLLSHISGYSDLAVGEHAGKLAASGGFEPGAPPAGLHPALHVYLEGCWSAPLTHRPGQWMEYCNHNYELLGEIVRRVSGRDVGELGRERLFAPLGMKDTCFRLPQALRGRVVERPADAPGAQPLGPPDPELAAPLLVYSRGFESEVFRDAPAAAGGAFSTAFDLAIFLQTLLGAGTYAGTRVLSRPAVEAMTRNQNPGVGGEFPPGQWHDEAGYGFGWLIQDEQKWPWSHGSLIGNGTFHHQGFGGAYVWADPATGTLGVWLGITLEASPHLEQFWNADLFQNLIAAAVLP